MKSLYMMHMIQTCGSNQTSKLDRYLNEDVENDIKNFDILGWWKVNSNKFPILSQLAQYVLDILVSIVSFESSFSTKGHILDSFRNSLTPKVVQPLCVFKIGFGNHPIKYTWWKSYKNLKTLKMVQIHSFFVYFHVIVMN